MLGFTCLSQSSISIPVPSNSTPTTPHCSNLFPFSTSLTLEIQPLIPRKPIRFVVFAENNNGLREPKEEDKQETQVASNGDDNSSKDRRPIFNFNWSSLLDPDPDNIIALGLTGLLTWASVQVLWQLFFISLAILLAALKYSFIAALLIFILITLL